MIGFARDAPVARGVHFEASRRPRVQTGRVHKACLRGDLIDSRVAHYSRVDGCEHRELLPRYRVGTVAKEAGMGLQYKACCGCATTFSTARTPVAAPLCTFRLWTRPPNRYMLASTCTPPTTARSFSGLSTRWSVIAFRVHRRRRRLSTTAANTSPSVEYGITSSPTVFPSRAAASSRAEFARHRWAEAQMAVDLNDTRSVNRDPAHTEG